MAAVIKYEEKDVPQFQKDECPKCVLKGRCIEEGKDNHWFLMCPHYHRWKLGYPESFISKQLQWQREHPEEAEEQHKKLVERAKKWKDEQKKAKGTKDTIKRSKSKKA